MSTVEAELLPPETKQAVAVREQGGAVGRALSASEITQRLQFIKQVMAENMTEGTDYGKIPGCGDKPGLFQPGAQKLSMTFQLNPSVREETITDYPNYHRGYRMIVRVENGPKFAEGVGECSTLESKYRYRSSNRKCPNCGKETILKSKHAGEGYFCWAKKGGCGAKFDLGDKAIEGQRDGKVEHENPPDFWNTVRKMAFKRAFIHAIINATNTSELWSQDLEDLAGNAAASADPAHRHPEPQHSSAEPEDDLPFEAATPAKSPSDAPAANTTQVKPKSSAPAKPAPAAGVIEATEEQKAKLIAQLEAEKDGVWRAAAYFVEIGALMPNEGMLDLPLRFVPRTVSQMRELAMRIAAFHQTGKPDKCVWFFDHAPAAPPATTKPKPFGTPPAKKIEVPRDANLDPNSPDAPWRSFPMPWGKHAGVPLADLEKQYLFGLWANYEVETEFNGKRKSAAQIAKDQKLRDMLDQAGLHYEFTKQD